MRSTFFGLNIARRALQTQQRALDVMGHNIANANTPGYSRQVALQTTTAPYTIPSRVRPMAPGQVGTGVHVSAIVRLRDQFIDMQLRNEIQSAGRWQARHDALGQIELILMEPSDLSIRDAIDKFWESLQDLSKNPESHPARAVVRERAISLTQSFQHVYKQLKDLQADLNKQVEMEAVRVNSLAQRLADVNEQIRWVSLTGQNPNDLMDTRDLLLEELSEYVNARVVIEDDGTASVSVNGFSIVMGDRWTELRTAEDGTTGFYNIHWGDTDYTVEPKNGKLAGVLEARDVTIQGYLDDLDLIVQTIIDEFNAVHQAGYVLDGSSNGRQFFVGGGAEDFAVADAILNDLGLIAAAKLQDSPGDGTNALELAEVFHKLTMNSGSTSISDYFTALVSGAGVAAQQAGHMVDSQRILVDHLQGRQDAVAGVNLDEEMIDMIRFQQAYNAAARVVTAMDEVLDTIITRMGIVGR